MSIFLRAYEGGGRLLLRGVLGSSRLRARVSKLGGRAEPVDGRVLDDVIATLFAIDDLAGGEDMARHPPAVARLRIKSALSVVDAPGPADVEVHDTKLEDIRARTYTPAGLASPSPGLLFFHGGGFVLCGLDTHDALCRKIAHGAGCRVISVDYRLAPEHPFPAAVEDAVFSFRHVVTRAAELGIDPKRLGVCGDSAGGNLSAVVCQKTRHDELRPAVQVLLYPAVDATNRHPSHKTFTKGYSLTGTMLAWYHGHYFGGDPERARHPDISPLLTEDLRGLPPAIVCTSGFDLLRDEGDDYAKRLKEAGVEVVHRCFGSMPHGYAMMTQVPAAKAATDETIALIRAHWK